ncbi:retropepsin-like aspartic protease [Chloroflexota bacterium]
MEFIDVLLDSIRDVKLVMRQSVKRYSDYLFSTIESMNLLEKERRMKTRKTRAYVPVLVYLLTMSVLFFNIACSGPLPQKDISSVLEEAWITWEEGDVEQAEEFAKSVSKTQEGRHLLFLTAYVKGKYEESLLHYDNIDPSYSRYAELDRSVVEAYRHLSRYAEAEQFALSHKMEKDLLSILEQCSQQPLKATLSSLTEIPFAEHPLSEYFPAFEVQIQGQPVTAHIDTGGTFIHMGVERAQKFGIEVIPVGVGSHGAQSEEIYFGIARSFRLGEAQLENVPVVAFPFLDQQEFVIFGTNILQQFLSTLDYPNKRLILSPRNSPELQKNHLAMLPVNKTEMPFYLWGEHYMFARGGVAENHSLNFFIDSGIVSLHPADKGGIRQAAFKSSPSNFRNWGFDLNEVSKGVFESPLSLSLGSLEQNALLCIAPENFANSPLGGIEIHGVLSHAFLNNYAWTLDFDQHRYIFSW